MFEKRSRAAGCFFLLCAVGWMSWAYGADQAKKETLILSHTSLLRYYETWRTDIARLKSGEIINVDPFRPRERVAAEGEKNGKKNGKKTYRIRKTDKVVGTPFPPSDWKQPDFDDSTWNRFRPPFLESYHARALLCVRGKFTVHDPAKLGALSFGLAFRGGAVVHLNGKEVTRAFMPKGAIVPDTPAVDYPLEAHVDPTGFMIKRGRWGRPHPSFPERYKQRTRAISDFKIPASFIKKGINVLAIEIHRAPAIEDMFIQYPKKTAYFPDVDARGLWWERAGLKSIRLAAETGSPVVSNTSRPKGLQVWNQTLNQRVFANMYGDPNESLKPVRLCGAKNGVFTGQVVVSASAPLKDLQASATALKHTNGATISTDHIEIRYPQKAGRRNYTFETLATSPLALFPVQPVWVSVKVPPKAPAGRYTGEVKISVEGASPVSVPIELDVVDWALPDSRHFRTHVGFVESPDSVAMQYKVPMWSKRHFELLNQVFEYMGTVGADTVYLPLIRRTHFGNEHSMVRWIKQKDGSYKHDFSIVEKYLDIATRHLGKVPVVCLYLFEPFTSILDYRGRAREKPSGMPYTEWDPETGELKEMVGPKWGTPEVRTFWRPVIEGIRDILEKRGLADSMMFGVVGDQDPDKFTRADIAAIIPNPKWVAHSHWFRFKVGGGRRDKDKGQAIGYMAAVGGAIGVFWDPDDGRPFYGWKNPFRVVTFPRDWYGRGPAFRQWTGLAVYRLCAEGAMLSGRLPKGKLGKSNRVRKDVVSMGRHKGFDGFQGLRGFGRLGIDFWGVLKGPRRSMPLRGRYPESQWGTVELGHEGAMLSALSPGKDGPLSTVRFELIRLAVQEAEVRMFVQDAVFEEAQRARLGEKLAARCQALLTERTRAFRHLSELYAYNTYGVRDRLDTYWEVRSRRLYELAAEVSRALKQ